MAKMHNQSVIKYHYMFTSLQRATYKIKI